MKRLLTGLASLCLATVLSATTVTVNYTADNNTIFPNPERGYYVEFDHVVTKSDPWCVKNRSDLDGYVSADKLSLILVLYYLDNFKTTETLPNEVFKGFEEDMQVLRNKGLKCILRFAYTDNWNNATTGYDATLDIVQKHIAQYKSHWKANADVIYVFQAGFVGTWGEWFYTSNFDNQSNHMTDSRRAVVDTLLKAVPEDRFIQLRTPRFKSEYLYGLNKENYASPLTAGDAYKNTPIARLGHHNDAFLAGDDNMGTYVNPTTQKAYLEKETLYVPIGGETCIGDKNDAEEWATYEKTTVEMSRLHWTFLQGYYSQVVTNWWREKDNGTFDELNRKMGYRYQLVSGTYSNEVGQGGKLTVNMKIKNVGYAPLYNERPAYIVLKKGSKTYSLKLTSDPRGWLPNGATTTVYEQLTLPSDIPAGTYQLYLHLPDKYASLAADPRYAVRFANDDVWDSSTGMNNLNASVTVTTSQTPPDDPPTPDPGDAIVLPATLDKSNVNAVSADMKEYNEYKDYLVFGIDDAQNTERWAEWKVQLKTQGKYLVSEEMLSLDMGGWYLAHSWQLQLINDASDVVAEYTTEELHAEGKLSYDEKWNLSTTPVGNYTLRVMNVTEWGRPKLKSLTLDYDSEIATGEENLQMVDNEKPTGDMFDILGRPVSPSYRGVILSREKKFIRL